MGNPRLLFLLCFAAVLSAVGARLCAQDEKDHSADFNIFLFDQRDDGGNPIFNEEFAYVGARAAVKMKLDEVLTLRPTMTISTINTGPAVKAPDTVGNATDKLTNATTASASATYFSLSGVADVRPKGSNWLLSPGAFFSYQPTYVSRGVDFAARDELLDGNFVLSFSYGLRWDSLTGGNLRVAGVFGAKLKHTDIDDGFDRSLRNRVSHNLTLGFSQVLSPDWLLAANVQYTRQDGYLATPNDQVTIYAGDTPVLFSDERLPNSRNRLQLNLRVRFSPLLHFSLAMDHSAYWDDWGIVNLSAQPAVAGTFGVPDARWRLWYRFAWQRGTRFHHDKPERRYHFQTDDPDLGSFISHNGGLLLWFNMPETGRWQWLLTVSGNVMYRDDGIWGFGVLAGTQIGW